MPRRRPADEAIPSLSDVAGRMSAGYTTVGELAYSILREAIVTGALRPGQKLRQEAVAEAIGVSRIPVRSALMQLETEGLVILQPHKGAVVRPLTPERVTETYAVRALLEVEAIRLAAKTITPPKARTLEVLADKLDDPRRSREFLQDRVTFYHLLYDRDENPVLVGMIDQLRSSVGRDLLGLRVRDHAHHHREIVDLVVAGDAAGARRWVKAHLQNVCEGLLEQLEEQPA